MSRLKSPSTFINFFFQCVLLLFLSFTCAQSLLGPPIFDIPWRAGHSACIISNYMVIFGGVTSSSIDIFTNPAASNDVIVWNLVDEQWYRPSITAVAGSTIPLPQKFVPCIGFPNGKMFVLMANTTMDQTNVAKNIAVLDVTQWNWQDVNTYKFVENRVFGVDSWAMEMTG